MESKNVRYTIPTKYDKAPQGQVTCVFGDENSQFFIQVSPDDEAVLWVPLGDFFTRVLSDFIDDPMFIQECLTIYQGRSDKNSSYQILANILGESPTRLLKKPM